MTRDEILNMPAGREMEALILEYVFGANWYNRNGRNFLLMPEDVVEWDGKTGRIEGKIPDYIGGFNWSVDIAKAWEVLEKMRLDCTGGGEPDYITLICYKELKPTWYCAKIWAHHDGDIPEIEVTAETAPLAICRAALLAVMNL